MLNPFKLFILYYRSSSRCTETYLNLHSKSMLHDVTWQQTYSHKAQIFTVSKIYILCKHCQGKRTVSITEVLNLKFQPWWNQKYQSPVLFEMHMLYLSQLVSLDKLYFPAVSANVNADFQAPFLIRENKQEKLIKTDYR